MSKKPTTLPIEINYAALGRALGRDRRLVWQWFQPGRQVPAKWVRPVSSFTGIPPHVLRPDVYDAPEQGRAA